MIDVLMFVCVVDVSRFFVLFDLFNVLLICVLCVLWFCVVLSVMGKVVFLVEDEMFLFDVSLMVVVFVLMCG